ncbi:unnamed protein product [Nezara viridula]|uniref:Sin3 histone deacetylase corepressor complex component SDS3 n=1 Tax=Nezara viridula TaxID=85310 RepID=A0A9P0HMC4_NEZVI|nr:unnamed protein product [Nezara viridula]
MNLRNMTSINSPHYSSNYGNDEYDFEEDNDDLDEDGDADQDESDEDTEEASETENRKLEPSIEVTDIKEQIYLEKLNNFKSQLQQLIDGTYPDYLRKVKKLELQYKERLRLNQIWREHQIDITEKDFIAEKKAATKELEEKVVELKENLIQDMEEKRKIIEAERVSMELSGDSTESKPAMTRKLRRRPNDPAPIPEKRRGKLASLPTNINFLLDEKEIEADLKAIARGVKPGSSVRKPANGLQSLGPIIPDSTSSPDIRIEDGKLLYDRKWFHRGQTVFVEGKDLPKFPATISAIGSEAISVKKTIDNTKIRIYISQLIRGKVTIKRRAS